MARALGRDNVVVERFWRSIKYEEVYLRAYDSAPEAKRFIGRYVTFYNQQRRTRRSTAERRTLYTSTSRPKRRHSSPIHHITRAGVLFEQPRPPLSHHTTSCIAARFPAD